MTKEPTLDLQSIILKVGMLDANVALPGNYTRLSMLIHALSDDNNSTLRIVYAHAQAYKCIY